MNINKLYFDPNEKPMDNPVINGGFTAILRSVGCIGDSLSSGEFEALNEDGTHSYHDLFEYSWGQFMARDAGLTVRNFSRGGMTASEYVETFAEKMGYWDPSLACKSYIIALGVNDFLGQHQEPGTAADVFPAEPEKNAKTFMGYMGVIMSHIRKIEPRCRIFLVTMARTTAAGELQAATIQRNCMYGLAKLFPYTYVIDLFEHGPVYDDTFRERFLLLGHMSPMGYRLTATMFESYIDYIIRHHIEDFKEYGYVGTDIVNHKEQKA